MWSKCLKYNLMFLTVQFRTCHWRNKTKLVKWTNSLFWSAAYQTLQCPIHNSVDMFYCYFYLNELLKSYIRYFIERSEIRKKQHDFKSVHFECRMVVFCTVWEKSQLSLICPFLVHQVKTNLKIVMSEDGPSALEFSTELWIGPYVWKNLWNIYLLESFFYINGLFLT